MMLGGSDILCRKGVGSSSPAPWPVVHELNLAPFLDPVGAIFYRRSPVTTNNGQWVSDRQKTGLPIQPIIVARRRSATSVSRNSTRHWVIEHASDRLERVPSMAAGVCPRLAAPLPRRVLEQAGRPPGAISVSCQAEHQLAAVPVPGQAEPRAGAVQAQQVAAPDERVSYRLPAVASWCRRGRSVTLLPARCCRASSRSTPGRPREYVSQLP